MSTQERITVVPPSYPDLVDEQWMSLCGEEGRQTLIPTAPQQMSLELECAGLDTDEAKLEFLYARIVNG